MVLPQDEKILKDFEQRLKKEGTGLGSAIKPRDIIIICGILMIVYVIFYLDTRDIKYFEYATFTGIGAVIILLFIQSTPSTKGFPKDYEARMKLGRILLEYQNHPSDRFSIPLGDIEIKDLIPEEDMYNGDLKYFVYQVFIKTPYQELFEFTAKMDSKNDLMYLVEGPYVKKKQKVKYVLAPELQGALQAMRGYGRKE